MLPYENSFVFPFQSTKEIEYLFSILITELDRALSQEFVHHLSKSRQNKNTEEKREQL